ncbi:hypothetical protein C414_000010081 [Campylobacter jejuni subsp. jejuni 414]|nr:hypothetical protein C414_000010081 [Campylobacter jejuni subsp. jejuni 414]
MADTPDLGSGAAMREGSSPFIRTTILLKLFCKLICNKFLSRF